MDIDPDGFGRNFPFGDRQRLGVQLMPLSDQLATYFGVKGGVLVASVEADSPAARAGLKAGDVISTVNSRAVSDAGDVRERDRPGGIGTEPDRDARQEGSGDQGHRARAAAASPVAARHHARRGAAICRSSL